MYWETAASARARTLLWIVLKTLGVRGAHSTPGGKGHPYLRRQREAKTNGNNRPCWLSPSLLPLAQTLWSYHVFHNFPLCIQPSIKVIKFNCSSGLRFLMKAPVFPTPVLNKCVCLFLVNASLVSPISRVSAGEPSRVVGKRVFSLPPTLSTHQKEENICKTSEEFGKNWKWIVVHQTEAFKRKCIIFTLILLPFYILLVLLRIWWDLKVIHTTVEHKF